MLRVLSVDINNLLPRLNLFFDARTGSRSRHRGTGLSQPADHIDPLTSCLMALPKSLEDLSPTIFFSNLNL
jgi:hypothetical protein